MAIVYTALGVAAGLLGPALFSLTGMGARLKAGGSSVFKTQKSSRSPFPMSPDRKKCALVIAQSLYSSRLFASLLIIVE
jgi:hypothetical protein